MMHTTASALIQLLESYGVSCVFGIPGVHTVELYRSLASSDIEHITPRHEQGAGFMADGYARVSRKPGVCFIISGPGMTNIMTSLAQAWSESIPMLVISSVNSHGRMSSGDGWLHELENQQATINGVCAFSHTLHSPAELKQVLARAFAVFNSERPRPIHIEIPINIVEAPYTDAIATRVDVMNHSVHASVAAPALISLAAQKLSTSTRTVILAGGGSRHSSLTIQKLAERLDAPVVMTVNARGVLPDTHALAVSVSASLPAVRELIRQADVVLGIGTEMGPTDYDFFEDGGFQVPGFFIRIDIDAQQIQRSHQPQLALVGDAQATCSALLESVNSLDKNSSMMQASSTSQGQQLVADTNTRVRQSLSVREQSYINVLTCIRDSLDDVIIVGDSTQLVYTGNSALGMLKPGTWFNSAMGFGTLGYALPAAIGAAQAATGKQKVVAICGDGGLQFCLAELASAIDARLSIILIVHVNGGYREIKNFMEEKTIQPLGVELMSPDFIAIANAFQWQTIELESMRTLVSSLQTAARHSTPTMIVINDELFDELSDKH